MLKYTQLWYNITVIEYICHSFSLFDKRGRTMVKILMFIPHLDMKETFRRVVEKAPQYDDIKIELTHVFGTPEVLSKNMDAEIVVARGMTHDWLKARFPEKHMVKIE